MFRPDASVKGELASTNPFEAEIQQFYGELGPPAFVKRSQDVDDAIRRLEGRCRRARAEMLEMVHLRLRQWSGVAVGPEDWSETFDRAVSPFWELADAPEAPRWAVRAGSARRRRSVGRDLIASIARFNRRWSEFLESLDLQLVNDQIDGYNRFYLIEKEAMLGSDRLAAHGFRPRDPMSPETLQDRFPMLPEPRLRA